MCVVVTKIKTTKAFYSNSCGYPNFVTIQIQKRSHDYSRGIEMLHVVGFSSTVHSGQTNRLTKSNPANDREEAALRHAVNTRTHNVVEKKAAYPENEVEEEEHVLDAFGAAFDSHCGPLDRDIWRRVNRTAAGQVTRRVTG